MSGPHKEYRAIEIQIIRWAEARKIIPNSTPQAQLLKMFEEAGELAAAIARKKLDLTKDAVGDVMVCLINVCALLDIDLVECMHESYMEIKDRKGTMMPNGIFVKDDKIEESEL